MTIVEKFRDQLRQHYVFPEVAEKIDEILADGLASGRYAVDSEAELAALMTADAQRVNGDKHLRLLHHVEELPEPADESRAAQEAAFFAEMIKVAARTASGMARVERLDGNIGFLDIRPRLLPALITAEAITAAMTLVADADALVIDVRGCVGGEPAIVAHLLSYLFDDEETPLTGIYERATDSTRQWWTQASVPGRRFGAGKPVYVLIGPNTFSGGEQVAYDLKVTGRATLVGQATRGGAHPRIGVRLSAHLEASIPTARAVHPLTGTNWEGVGVAPDVEVDADAAYETALSLVRRTN
ncbi:MAG: S41 family peptidase [Hamadaea sp.]|nr:S41 family peptidase [Hamadaea sp.]NUR49177.1 S41 family peptidase [Hamadaea sp.]NUT06973.1 S41 family peptidase [Hamadaea sp.]